MKKEIKPEEIHVMFGMAIPKSKISEKNIDYIADQLRDYADFLIEKYKEKPKVKRK